MAAQQYSNPRGLQGSYRQGAQHGSGHRNFQQEKKQPSEKLEKWSSELKDWVTNGIKERTVNFAEDFGKTLKEQDLSTSQIRIAFGELRKIQMNGFVKEYSSFLMLKAKLAYAAQRHKEKNGVEEFYQFFGILYEAVNKDDKEVGRKQFDNLLQVVEAVLAFHKYYGGQ